MSDIGFANFYTRLKTAGIEAGDSDDLKLKKSLVMFAAGLMTFASVGWLGIYWLLGMHMSSSLPVAYQLVSVATIVVYAATRSFDFFRYAQLTLFLFYPFVIQWSMGNFVSASGIILWGLLAPIGAILVLSARESIPWFVAYIVLTIASGVADYNVVWGFVPQSPSVPLKTSVVFFALNFTVMSVIIYLLLRFAAQEREKYQAELEKAYGMLKTEQERSERLLLNILPGSVAERLKNSDKTIADGFADVTVMFADIVNFTRIAEGMAPSQVFTMLNRIFSSFDALAERLGLEKIKTIGDAYMVAGGLNVDLQGRYADAIADMALAMRELLVNDAELQSLGLELRVGIGTGPVVAGVVGTKKFIYDLWGDTVNIASRITSEGVPGMIHVDQTTWRRLRERFDFNAPQTIHLKGKGDTVVYRLMGRSNNPQQEQVHTE
jgi:adenylate cyclase